MDALNEGGCVGAVEIAVTLVSSNDDVIVGGVELLGFGDFFPLIISPPVGI